MVEQPNESALAGRLSLLSHAHRRGIDRFRRRLKEFLGEGSLNTAQVRIVEEFLVRLGETNKNPSNTGNLEDLFCYTLNDTSDPIRAFAQALADCSKVVPMQPDAKLMPRLRAIDSGKIFSKVSDLDTYNEGDKMLVTHTMVAYGNPELLELARAFIRATFPTNSPAEVERKVAGMIVQSQHGPSSTFVLARTRGLTIEVGDVYSQAGYDEKVLTDAQRFYDICSRFQPQWVVPFLDGYIPNTSAWSEWRNDYLTERLKLPEELVYQLASDTLTNFLDGTLESGKWTDASIVFGGVTQCEQVPGALAKIVNQYIAEHVALHNRPAHELVHSIAEPLEPWGVIFEHGRATALAEPPNKHDQIREQFEASIARARQSGLQKAPRDIDSPSHSQM